MKYTKTANQKVDTLVNDVTKFRDLMYKQFKIDPKAGQVYNGEEEE
jgi:hypothetical protein